VVLDKVSGERVAIEFKFLPMKGATGKNRAIHRYITGIVQDIRNHDYFINDTELKADSAFFFIVTENKNVLTNEYTCQKDIENFPKGSKISIGDGKD